MFVSVCPSSWGSLVVVVAVVVVVVDMLLLDESSDIPDCALFLAYAAEPLDELTVVWRKKQKRIPNGIVFIYGGGAPRE